MKLTVKHTFTRSMTIGNMNIPMSFGKTAFACLIVFLATQRTDAAATTLLKLSCKGEITTTFEALYRTIKEKDAVGVIVNLTKRTVSLDGDVVPFTQADETTVYFGGTIKDAQSDLSSEVHGHLDRISGAFAAMRLLSRRSSIYESYGYKMVCKPAKPLL
jgi:hypothetical protein